MYFSSKMRTTESAGFLKLRYIKKALRQMDNLMPFLASVKMVMVIQRKIHLTPMTFMGDLCLD